MPFEGSKRATEIMTKGDSGLWSYTTKVLPSDLYTYSFLVDGLKTIDPNNAYVIRDVASVTSTFVSKSEKANYFRINNVPHWNSGSQVV